MLTKERHLGPRQARLCPEVGAASCRACQRRPRIAVIGRVYDVSSWGFPRVAEGWTLSMAIDFNSINDEQFEEMCRLLVLAEHPDATPVEPLQGDEGIDSFVGVIDEQVDRIWQFKYFKTGIGANQQDQVRRSLVKAISQHRPKSWTLVMSADVNPGFLRWLKRQQQEFPDTRIEVIPESAVKALLIKHQGIRKLYFPLVDEKNDMVLKAMGERGLLSDTKPKAALVKDMQRAVEVVNDNSPDFKFTVTSSEDGQEITVEPRHEGANGKTVLSMGLSFSTEDAEAAAALEDYQRMLREGRPLTLDGRHVTIKESVFDELLGESFTMTAMTLKPEVPLVETPLRLVARFGEREAILPFVAMRLVRRGQSEFEVSNTHDPEAPATFAFTFRYDDKPSTANFQLRDYDGKHPSNVIDVERFISLMAHESATVELVNIRDGKSLGSGTVSEGSLQLPDERLQFFEDLLVIEEKVNPDLIIVPDKGTPVDVVIARAMAVAATGEIVVPSIVATVVTSPEQTDVFRQQIVEHGTEGLSLWGRSRETVELFGVPYTSHIHFRVQGASEVVEEHPDGSVTMQIDGEMWMKHEAIRAGVRLEDELREENEGDSDSDS